MSTIEPGIYVHYKSEKMKYEVIGVGMNSETQEEYVIYRPLYKGDINPELWVRPYEMFVGTVVVDGVTKRRFQKISEIDSSGVQ